ncbi:serine/threonine-protein kinase MARK2-like [Artibeus jamaicensis]|uniref:serine/threonine-protein kinase MARK2-like n=1 Tax=Artibeus jamaicensis TaxID=9417 RepID=UPI00235A8F90|nr:serine/threonine-protein kinase MARK2-like [Artibeus jamaicensis]
MPEDFRASPDKECRIGGYVLLSTIGKGSFAKVMLARHIVTGAEVAVKITNRQGSSLAYRECQSLKKLNHPNVIKLFEVIATQDHYYFFMEHLSGGELQDYLEKYGARTEEEARTLFRQLLSALHYCHQKGVVHRDLKPENILLDADHNIKLADFGLSKEFSKSKLTSFCGTVTHIAPEILSNRPYDGPKADIWSLGVILYNIVTGRLPFDGDNFGEVKKRVLRGHFLLPRFVSEECQNLLRSIMTLDPTERPTLEDIIKDPWVNKGSKEGVKLHCEPPSGDIDHQITEKMKHLGYDQEEIRESRQHHSKTPELQAVGQKRNRPASRPTNVAAKVAVPATSVAPRETVPSTRVEVKLAVPSASSQVEVAIQSISVNTELAVPSATSEPQVVTEPTSVHTELAVSSASTEPEVLTESTSVHTELAVSSASTEPEVVTESTSVHTELAVPSASTEPEVVIKYTSVHTELAVPSASSEPEVVIEYTSVHMELAVPSASSEPEVDITTTSLESGEDVSTTGGEGKGAIKEQSGQSRTLSCPGSRAATPRPALHHSSLGSFTTATSALHNGSSGSLTTPGSRESTTRSTKNTRSTNSSQSSSSHHGKGRQQGPRRTTATSALQNGSLGSLTTFSLTFWYGPSGYLTTTSLAFQNGSSGSLTTPRRALLNASWGSVTDPNEPSSCSSGSLTTPSLAFQNGSSGSLTTNPQPDPLGWPFWFLDYNQLGPPEWLFSLPRHTQVSTPEEPIGLPFTPR